MTCPACLAGLVLLTPIGLIGWVCVGIGLRDRLWRRTGEDAP